MGDPSRCQPVNQREQLDRHRPKRLEFGHALPVLAHRLRNDATRGDALLMDVQPSAMCKHYVHPSSLLVWWAGRIPISIEAALRAWLLTGSWRHFMVPTGIRVQFCH